MRARTRFASCGVVLALAVAALAPLLARAVPIGAPAATFALAALSLALLGYAIGARLEMLERCSYEDPVTHVGNRRHWERRLGQEVDRALASGMPLSLLMLDVDNLKKLNDAHGHGCGDRALRIVGDVLLETCRSRDVAARFGGDEFVLLLPRTRPSEAEVVAERVRAAIALRRDEVGACGAHVGGAHVGGAHVGAAPPFAPPLSVSIGIAELATLDDPSGKALFEAADRALYAAKSAGRDRVARFVPPGRTSGVIAINRPRDRATA